VTTAVAQPTRFLIVGVGGYVVNVGVFAVLLGRGLSYLAASVLSYFLSNALMYIGNRYFTFGLGHAGFWRAYASYMLVGSVVVALTAALLAVLVEWIGVDPRLGQAVALLVVTPVAFVLFKRWTFKPQVS
jgi:putative flippase GtrA